jgi:hypothetical protein
MILCQLKLIRLPGLLNTLDHNLTGGHDTRWSWRLRGPALGLGAD